MTKKRIFWLVVILFAGLFLYNSTKEEPEEPLLVPETGVCVIARRTENGGEFLYGHRLNDVPGLFNDMNGLERTEKSTLEMWQYKVVMTNSLLGMDYKRGVPLFTVDEEACVICVYNSSIEIDGIAYTTEHQEYILEWFGRVWDKYASMYPVYEAR